MGKSADAFRTISEVADWLETPAHVLRFWESKFPQIKPVKRAGGRRYYRPADMELIGGIKKLLHDDGMTIKGVQKILRDQGVKHVAALSPAIDGEMGPGDTVETTAAPTVAPPDDSATVLPFQRAPETEPEPEPAAQGETVATDQSGDTTEEAAPPEPEPADLSPENAPAPDTDAPAPADTSTDALPAFLHHGEATPQASPPRSAPRHDPRPDAGSDPQPGPPPSEADAPADPDPAPPRPARIDLSPDPADDSITAPPGLLTAIAARKGKPLAPDARAELRALRDRLAALHARRSGAAETTAPD